MVIDSLAVTLARVCKGNGARGRVIACDLTNTGRGVLECAGEDGSKKVDGGRRCERSRGLYWLLAGRRV